MKTILTLTTMVLLLIGLSGCESPYSTSGASECTSTTQTDANGNPISTVGCGNT